MNYAGVLITSAKENIQNDLIYIEAFNGFVWGGATDYLIDYSFTYDAS